MKVGLELMSVEAPNPMPNRQPPRRPRAYYPPSKSYSHGFSDLLVRVGRVVKQGRETSLNRDAIIFYAGNLGILENRAVSIVGSRDVTRDGRQRAAEVARELAMAGVTVVSGLAKGVDTTALTSAIANGGRVAAVIGTSLDKAYPAENAKLQRRIYADHLLMTPFQVGRRALRSNVPVRNSMMTAITDATVIIEAPDASGVLHQAAECVRQGRWLFITNSVAQDRALTWPKKFLGRPKVDVFSSTEDIMNTMAMGNT